MNYELEPTNDNLFKTIDEDIFQRNNDLSNFIYLLDTMEGLKTVAIDGGWGTGKTFFVKQCKLILELFNDNIKNDFFNEDINNDEGGSNKTKEELLKSKFREIENNDTLKNSIPVYYDAWKNDNSIDPIISLVYSIAKDMNDERLISNSEDICSLLLGIVEAATGKNLEKVIQGIKGNSIFDDENNENKLEEKIKKFFYEIRIERGNVLVVFIDELDRCNPEYAVKMLERIKHYFICEDVIFIFAVNLSQLEQTIKKHFGEQFEAGKYLDRFFDLRLSLSKPSMEDYYNSIGLTNTTVYERMCKEVINYYNMSIREGTKFYNNARLVNVNGNEYWFDSGKAKEFCHNVVLPFIIGCRMENAQACDDFINGNGDNMLVDYVEKSEYVKWWIQNYCVTENNDEVDIAHIVLRAYKALFVNKYVTEQSCIVEGMKFTSDHKNGLLRKSSGFVKKY